MLWWHFDKRRKHVSHIKTRSEMKCSKCKRFKQKGTGSARHATRAVGLFRGGAKWCGTKSTFKSRINSRFKLMSLRDSLIVKRNIGSLIIIDLISDKPNLTKYDLLIYSEELETVLNLSNVLCAQWIAVNTSSLIERNTIVITKQALAELSVSLTQDWSYSTKL
ncbi:MAG: 50S ribosomal protein L4 [Candidatus Hodgkinia cicadicola]